MVWVPSEGHCYKAYHLQGLLDIILLVGSIERLQMSSSLSSAHLSLYLASAPYSWGILRILSVEFVLHYSH